MKPQVFFFVLLAMCASAVLGTITLVAIVNNSLTSKSNEVAAATAQIQLAQQEIEAYEKLENDIESLEDERGVIDSFVVEGKAQAESIDELLAIIKRANVKVNPLTFESTAKLPDDQSQVVESTASSQVQSLPATLSATSSYNSLYSLLRGFETSERHINVKEITISSGNDGQLSYTMHIEIVVAKSVATTSSETGGEQ